MTAGDPPHWSLVTKAEAREAARQRAADSRAAAARRTRRNRLVGIGAAVLGLAAIAAVVVVIATSAMTASAQDALGRTTPPPWPAPADVEQRVHDAGLDMLSEEGTALHIHQHLTVTVDGKAVTVPALLGIDEAAEQISPIHTHDTSGIIHVESPVEKTFHLSQVFAEWDVRLAKGTVGSYRAGHDGVREAVFVNQKPYAGDPGAIVLRSHEDIDFVITTDGATPEAPTKAFTFPAGY